MTPSNYDLWDIKEADFPETGSMEQKIKFLINYGLLAPSTHNTQPWMFTIKERTLAIRPNLRYRLPEADPSDRNLFISLGCCAANIVVAAAHFGLVANIEITEEGINLSFSTGSNDKLGRLFAAITKRYSNKLPYSALSVADKLLDELKLLANDRVDIAFITDAADRRFIASLHRKTLSSYPVSFGKELSKWLRYNKTMRSDGMPAFVVGIKGLKQVIIKRMLVLSPKIFQKLGASDAALVEGSPVLGALFTRKNNRPDWQATGLVYEYMALTATSRNLNMTPLAAMIENDQTAKQLSGKFGKSTIPQMFFRLGYADNQPYHTPRRREALVN